MPTTNNKQKKDQFIAVCADSRDEAERLLPAARRMADCFHKGIIVFTCSPDGEQWVDTLGHPYAALKSDWPSAIEAMPTAFNVVLAMALCDHKARRDSMANPRQLLKNFRLSKVAYLSIPATVTELRFNHVGLSLDHQRESKEKLIWASYMARFCSSQIDVYHLPYTDPDFRNRCNNNFRYLDKIFSSLSLSYEKHILESSSQLANPDSKTLALGECDMLISLVPDLRNRDLFDLFATPQPLRLLRSAGHTPILFLNQRDDLYVMCD